MAPNEKREAGGKPGLPFLRLNMLEWWVFKRRDESARGYLEAGRLLPAASSRRMACSRTLRGQAALVPNFFRRSSYLAERFLVRPTV